VSAFRRSSRIACCTPPKTPNHAVRRTRRAARRNPHPVRQPWHEQLQVVAESGRRPACSRVPSMSSRLPTALRAPRAGAPHLLGSAGRSPAVGGATDCRWCWIGAGRLASERVLGVGPRLPAVLRVEPAGVFELGGHSCVRSEEAIRFALNRRDRSHGQSAAPNCSTPDPVAGLL
jgi:hypothetical protein